MTKRPGVITTIVVLGVTAVVMVTFLALAIISGNQVSRVGSTAASNQVFYAAESGINLGLNNLITHPGGQTFCKNFSGADVACGLTAGGKITVTIAIPPTTDPCYDNLQLNRKITSVALLAGIQRTLSVCSSTNASAGNIQYAVMSGAGGIDMANGSEIWGPLYANGPMTGGGTIYGDISNSGATGSVSGVTIGNNTNPTPSNKCPSATVTDPQYNNHQLKSHTLSNTQVFGKAYYQSTAGQVKAGTAGAVRCDQLGPAGDGVQCFGNQADPAPTNYPITPQQIQSWKDQADDTTTTGDVTIGSDTTIGPRKIIGNLTVTAGTVTIAGPLWVTGTIDINHPGVTIQLPTSAGDSSDVIITDQSIDIKNNALLEGNPNSNKSFLLVISLKNDISNWVIRGSNNSAAVIYFAPDGLILVSQNGGLNNTTGEKIQLENNACIQYDTNLSGFFIPNGPPQPVGTIGGSWNEL